MIDIELDANHDIVVANGDLRLISGGAAVAQHIKQRLLTILGEWFLDKSVGLPWFDTILGKHRTLDVVEALIRDQISNTPGVQALNQFSLEVDEQSERKARVTFSATLTTGETATLSLSV